MLRLIKENPISIEIDITDALTTLDKTVEDITDLAFVVKREAGDDDADAILLKKLSDDDIVLADNGKYYAPMVASDYEDFTVGKVYLFAVGILYSGIENFLELEFDDNKISVIGDYLRA